MTPKRIQRKRTKGWRMPLNTVYVGRPTQWGNPYRIGIDGGAQQCVALFARMVNCNVWSTPNSKQIQECLRGKNLACWCPLGQPCHADVLLNIANKGGGK